LEATWQTTAHLEEAIEAVKKSTPYSWLKIVPKKWLAAEKQAKLKLVRSKKEKLVQETFEMLKNADDDALLKHAKSYAYCLTRTAQLKEIEDKERPNT